MLFSKTYFTLLGIFILLFSQLSYAQIGIRAGFGLSTVGYTGDDDNSFDDASFDSKVNFHLGLGYEKAVLGDVLFIQPSLLYHHKGAASDFSDATLGLNYIEVPINIVYKYAADPFVLHAGGGLYFAYLLGGKVRGDNFDDFDIEVGTDENEDDYKPSDVGIGLTVGATYGAIGADLFYRYGFSNIEPALNDNNYRAYNAVLGISLFYKLGGNIE